MLNTGWLTYVDRICPGRHLADSSLFIVCASILLVFNITPELDARGKPMPLEPKFTKHLASSYVPQLDAACQCRLLIGSLHRAPIPFKCEIRARSAAARALVTAASVDVDA